MSNHIAEESPNWYAKERDTSLSKSVMKDFKSKIILKVKEEFEAELSTANCWQIVGKL